MLNPIWLLSIAILWYKQVTSLSKLYFKTQKAISKNQVFNRLKIFYVLLLLAFGQKLERSAVHCE